MDFEFDKDKLFLYSLLGIAVVLYTVIMRKKISYLFAPEGIISYYRKYFILTLGNLIPSLFLAAICTGLIREQIESSKYSEYENYALLAGLFIFIVFLAVIGIITDRILYYFNIQYKQWKDHFVKRKDNHKQ